LPGRAGNEKAVCRFSEKNDLFVEIKGKNGKGLLSQRGGGD
jgi:hypothetical protein